MDNDFLVLNLNEMKGGNVLIGPDVSGEKFRTDDLMLGFNRSDRPWKSEMHLHKESKEVYVILKGGCTLRVGNESVRLRSNQMLIVKEGVPHTIEDVDLPVEFFTIRAPAVGDKVIVEG